MALALWFQAVVTSMAFSPQCATPMTNSCMPTSSAFNAFASTNATACCEACLATQNCFSWTLSFEQSKCFLHPSAATTAKGKCTSGIARTPPPTPAPQPAPAGAKNVLLIIVDDLRPQISAFGESEMITPNIDRIASNGAAFSRAYCQQAICGPTRNSFLSGRRPARTKSWNFLDSFREVGPDWVAFPQFFKDHGYTTLGTGKTYHPGIPPNYDEPLSWSQEESYYMAPNGYPKCDVPGWDAPPSLACPNDKPIETQSDWLDMNRTRQQLRTYGPAAKAGGKPFFLAFGAHRPHLPWNVPRKFWDMYPATEDIALPTHQSAPSGMPPIAFTYELDGKTELPCWGQQYPVRPDVFSTIRPPKILENSRKSSENSHARGAFVSQPYFW
jgi:hypothetical protein